MGAKIVQTGRSKANLPGFLPEGRLFSHLACKDKILFFIYRFFQSVHCYL